LFGGGGRTTGKLHVYALSVDLRKTLSAFWCQLLEIKCSFPKIKIHSWSE
jgi:hypothetical protein